MKKEKLFELAEDHGTPLFILDHEIIRENYRKFKKYLAKVQAYYAIKANSDKEIIRTLFKEGASFDVASFNEFLLIYNFIEGIEKKKRHDYIWDKIIYSNTIKEIETLKKLKPYKPLVAYDNIDELEKIKENCDKAGLVLRLKVPDTGSQVEMGSKFGAEPSDALKLIETSFKRGLVVEGLSFHVGSQCTNFDNYVAALNISHEIFQQAKQKGYNLKLLDIGGGFPVPYTANVPRFEELSNILNSECERLFPKDIELIAEPGRFMVATAATLITQIIGKARREEKLFYHINDGVYHTFSGVVYDHWTPNFHSFKEGKEEICAVVGQTCDSFDKISLAEKLPNNLKIGDYLYTENIGAYSIASSTKFNGFEGAKVLHINR